MSLRNGGDSRLVTLSGGDAPVISLTGGDSRIVRLTGGDRLAPLYAAAGAGVLGPLLGRGSATVRGRASGAGVLGPLLGAGSATVTPFHPSQVPEVEAGYWYDSELSTNYGASNWRWTNQTGDAGFDQLQATVAAQPGILTLNGVDTFLYRGSSDPNPASTQNQTSLAAGWSGSTYIAYWQKYVSGITGANTQFRHGASSGSRRIALTRTGSQYISTYSNDATATFTFRWNLGSTTAEQFVEQVLDVDEPVATQRVKLYIDRVLQTPSLTASMPAVLANIASRVQVQSASGVAGTDSVALGNLYYCNGIPSNAHRDALYRYKALRPIP